MGQPAAQPRVAVTFAGSGDAFGSGGRYQACIHLGVPGQQAILERWPVEEDPPDRSTLSRWLKRATQQRLICCSGSGYRGDGFRYWLPGREPLLWPGDRASEAEKEAWRERCAAHYRALRERTAPA